MASFTDKVPTFNPYVQQLPIEEMVKVGMQKQQKYEEGVQKIQSNIDNVAGLDVARDVDKKYLESKLNALGNNLKSVAAGDFSNFQLVNSVNGMTNQITKDDNVINAVSSTAWLKKQKAEMEKAISEGKSSQSNQWDFSEKVGKYLNSETVGEKFNGRYTQYINVDEKWMGVMKSLHSDLTEQDIPYVRNDDGTLNRDATAAAMQRVSKEYVSSAKLENALRSSLSPDDLNQLSIDGRYTFREFDTPEKLAIYSQTRFGKQIELNNLRIKELDGVCNLNESNSEYQKKAQDAIDELQNKNEKLKGQLDNELELISADSDQAKATIYKNGAIEQFANSYAWEHNKENLMTNPIGEVERWEKNQALSIAKFKLDVRGQNWREFKDNFDMNMSEKEYDLKVAKQHTDLYGMNSPFTTYTGVNTNIKDPLSAMVDDEEAASQAASAGIVEVVKGIPGISSVQLKNAMVKYDQGDPNWYKLGYSDSSKYIPEEWREKVEQIIENKKTARRLNVARTKIVNEVESSPEFVKEENELNKKINSYGSIILKDNTGKNIVYSPKEISDLVNKTKTTMEYRNGQKYNYKTTYTSALSNKEKMFIDANLQGHGKNIYRNIANAVNDHKQTVGKRKEEAIQAKVLERGGNYAPSVTAITFSSEGGDIARRGWESVSSAVLKRYTDDKGGDEKLSKDDIAKGKKWISSEGRNNINYKKLNQCGKTFIILEKDGEEVVLPLETNESNQLPADPNQPDQEYMDVVNAQYMGNGSTNITGNYEDAYFGRSRMPYSQLDVKADLTWNKSNTAKQYVTLKLNTPEGIVSTKIGGYPMSREQAIPFIRNLTKAQIKQLYLNDPTVSDKIKQTIKNL